MTCSLDPGEARGPTGESEGLVVGPLPFSILTASRREDKGKVRRGATRNAILACTDHRSFQSSGVIVAYATISSSGHRIHKRSPGQKHRLCSSRNVARMCKTGSQTMLI